MPTNDSARSELMLLAVQNGYNANELVQYIDEDHVGGYHVQAALATWPSGSVWESEGQMLYALVRYLKPEHVVEIGCLYGCSTTHIASALLKNGSGWVTSVDNGANGQRGELIPLDKREVIKLVNGDGGDYLEGLADNSVDFIFEDAGHGEEDVYRFTVLAMRKLKPGGLLINHDAMHDLAYYGDGNKVPADDGQKIRAGLTRAGVQFQTYKPHESDCGFAVTRKAKDEYREQLEDGFVESLKYVSSPRVKVDSEAIDPTEEYKGIEITDAAKVSHAMRGLTWDLVEDKPDLTDALSTGAPLNSDGFLKPAVLDNFDPNAAPPDANWTNVTPDYKEPVALSGEADQAKWSENDFDDKSEAYTRMPTQPPDGIETLNAMEAIINNSPLAEFFETTPTVAEQEAAERESKEPPAKKPRKPRAKKAK